VPVRAGAIVFLAPYVYPWLHGLASPKVAMRTVGAIARSHCMRITTGIAHAATGHTNYYPQAGKKDE
jgi:hypothetical protein